MASGPTVSHCVAGQWAWRPDTSGTAQVSVRLLLVRPPLIKQILFEKLCALGFHFEKLHFIVYESDCWV